MKEITKHSLENLKKELTELKTKKRAEVAQRIKEAIEFGDISENAEFNQAKEDQAFVEGRIAELENLIKNTVLVNDSVMAGSVKFGSEIQTEIDGKIETYKIVDFTEVDASKGYISTESPLGKALLDKQIGDMVMVTVPSGTLTFKIISIQ